jgi:RNA polymerase-interacting CarD/CdnL/TRCF family regulator
MVELAEEKDQMQIASELKQHGLRQAVEKGDLKAVRWYLKRGAQADQAMIEYAERKRYGEITKLLTSKPIIKSLMSWWGKKKTSTK